MIQSWTPSPRRTRVEVDEARKRVKFVNGHYRYEPSPAYRRMLGKMSKKGLLIPIVQEPLINEF